MWHVVTQETYSPDDFVDPAGILVVMVACLVATYLMRRWGKRVIRSKKPYVDPMINILTLVPMTCFVIVASSAGPVQDIAKAFVSATSKYVDFTDEKVQGVAGLLFLVILAYVGYVYVREERVWALWTFGVLMAAAAVIVPNVSDAFMWITYNLIMIPWNIFWTALNDLVDDWY